ncbi:MAG: helix-turn-helix domain-containing protein [Porphyromonadaceae bacterium]|nr:helix-turn-helix domain-containing protein [Porphyromonadaceae bacterium]
MEKTDYGNSIHLGRKIERVRRLRGLTQSELGGLLGISKQAISKIEQTEKLNDDRLIEIATVLGVTLEGIKKYDEVTVLYNSNSFYMNYYFDTAITSHEHTFSSFPINKTIELFEKLLDNERVKFESLKKEKELQSVK